LSYVGVRAKTRFLLQYQKSSVYYSVPQCTKIRQDTPSFTPSFQAVFPFTCVANLGSLLTASCACPSSMCPYLPIVSRISLCLIISCTALGTTP